MSIAFESDEQQLRKRLRKMSDVELVQFGKAARSLCRDPRCPDVFRRQLEEARAEWRGRHPKAQLIIRARRKLEEVDFPGFTFSRWTRAWSIRTVCETFNRRGGGPFAP